MTGERQRHSAAFKATVAFPQQAILSANSNEVTDRANGGYGNDSRRDGPLRR
jgi:hypothetical protein